jgi:hypothetical protein
MSGATLDRVGKGMACQYTRYPPNSKVLMPMTPLRTATQALLRSPQWQFVAQTGIQMHLA